MNVDFTNLNFKNTPIPNNILNHPGMISNEEKTFLYNLAKNYYLGKGTIIDAGTFLGAGTIALAAGVKENKKFKEIKVPLTNIIQSYELALWDTPAHDECNNNQILINALAGKKYQNNENFFPLIQNLLVEHLDIIKFYIGDITLLVSSDYPIEIAFYDCLKNYEKDYTVFKALVPYYIPGHTIVIQQDYFYERALHNKIRQNYFSEYYEFLGTVQASAVYRYTKEIPKELIENDPLLTLSYNETLYLLKKCINNTDDLYYQIETSFSLVEFMIQVNKHNDALEILDQLSIVIQNNIEKLLFLTTKEKHYRSILQK